MKFISFIRKDSVRHLVFLAATIWVAHFLYSGTFGYYEDDYAHITPALSWNWTILTNQLIWVFEVWPQGRPLNFFLPQFFSLFSNRLGGLGCTYILAFVIQTINVTLFYSLVKQVSSQSIAVLGALAFCLFPANTTHSFLVHAFHLQTSLTFLLLACKLYLSDKRNLSYLIIPLTLLTYESPFMVFFAIPLFRNGFKWDRSSAYELGRHAVILLGMLLVISIIRIVTGEGRIAEVGISIRSGIEVPIKILVAIFIGPLASLAFFFYGPIRSITQWNWEIGVIFLASLVAFVPVFRRLAVASSKEESVTQVPLSFYPGMFQRVVKSWVCYFNPSRVVVVGISMLCLSYTLSFTHFPPLAWTGRGTSVHLAATFGGSLIFAYACSWMLSIADRYRLRKYAVVALALYFALLLSYRVVIQLDFKQAWKNQQSFWTVVVEKLPDLEDETIIFVTDKGLDKTRAILTHSWADPIILMQIFQFPTSWKNPPRLFIVPVDLSSFLIRQGDQIKWQVPVATWGSHWEVLPNTNVILVEMEEGKLVRRDGSIIVDGLKFDLKPIPSGKYSNLEKGALYDYLIQPPQPASNRFLP